MGADRSSLPYESINEGVIDMSRSPSLRVARWAGCNPALPWLPVPERRTAAGGLVEQTPRPLVCARRSVGRSPNGGSSRVTRGVSPTMLTDPRATSHLRSRESPEVVAGARGAAAWGKLSEKWGNVDSTSGTNMVNTRVHYPANAR